MKVKDANGNEVEVPDTDPVAIAARELERVKGLGFDSIESYVKTQESELEKLRKQTKSDQEFIDRQKNELGDLRKKVAPVDNPKPPSDAVETQEEREDRFRKLNAGIMAKLSDDEKSMADKAFLDHYNKSTPEQQSLLRTFEGRNAFIQAVVPATKGPEPGLSLFESQQKPALSIAEQVLEALKRDDKGRGRQPAAPRSDGSGFEFRNQQPAQPPPSNVMFNGLYPG